MAERLKPDYEYVEEHGAIKIRSRRAPLYIEVRETGQGLTVRIGHEGLDDFLSDVVDSEEDPRGYIEELADELSKIAHDIYLELARRGLHVKLEARETIMDLLEKLEELEEE
jgi:hypothetical protein